MRYWHPVRIAMSLCLVMSGVFFSTAEGGVCEVLEKISVRANLTDSDVVLIVHDGKMLGVYGSANQNKPVDARGVTQSFVSLAVGLLIQEGKIASLDTPVSCFFPEWRQGCRAAVTVRHLLTQTSGMAIDDSSCVIYEYPDVVRMALATDFSATPGTHFELNNKAVNLLGGIVEKAAGVTIQQYLKSRLFFPLGINSDSWLCDAAGNNYGMSHLTINGVDLAKIGMLVAQNGCWNGIRLISQDWINELMKPSQLFTPFYSGLWWLDYYGLSLHWDDALIDIYAAAGVPAKFICSLKSLHGYVVALHGQINNDNYIEQCAADLARYFGSRQDVYDFFALIASKGLPLARWEAGAIRGISARGMMGQQLIIIPDSKLVAVRLSNQKVESCGLPDTFADLGVLLGDLSQAFNNTPYEAKLDKFHKNEHNMMVPFYRFESPAESEKRAQPPAVSDDKIEPPASFEETVNTSVDSSQSVPLAGHEPGGISVEAIDQWEPADGSDTDHPREEPSVGKHPSEPPAPIAPSRVEKPAASDVPEKDNIDEDVESVYEKYYNQLEKQIHHS